MTKEERKALIKAGREDSVKYQSKAAVKQKKVHFHISLLFLAFPCPPHHDFSLMDILPGKSTREGPRTSECTISNGAVEDEILLLNGNAENFASLQPLQSEISRESSFPSGPINAKNLSKNQRHDPTENAINKMLKKNDSTKTKINPH
ncbi:hypothetical protein Tco_1088780 [Tanacetum coccineum]